MYGKLIIPIYCFLVFPVVLEELLLLRNINHFINPAGKCFVKPTLIISTILIMCSLIFQVLYFTGVIDQRIFPDGPRAASSLMIEMVLLTEWPVIVVSFILGSIRYSGRNCSN